MGVQYGVGCKQCGVWRDLDKLRGGFYGLKDRYEAMEQSAWLATEEAESGRFSAVLLCSFMQDHQGHDCVLFNDLVGRDEATLGFPAQDHDFYAP